MDIIFRYISQLCRRFCSDFLGARKSLFKKPFSRERGRSRAVIRHGNVVNAPEPSQYAWQGTF
jgi:hypothetical protein